MGCCSFSCAHLDLQAILVAAVFEFLGAVLLGFSVTDTIRSNIAKLPQFSPTPGQSAAETSE